MKNNKDFKMPNPVKITGRISSLTNSFVNGVIPVINPTEEQVNDALAALGMENGIKCAYCGGRYTEWDHFHPLVVDKKPSGHISEINNLVPCCSVCNSSKGNKDWKVFMKGKPEKDTDDWKKRYKLLEDYDKREKLKISDDDFQRICGDIWARHWENLDNLIDQIREYQVVSDKIRGILREEYVSKSQVTKSATSSSAVSTLEEEIRIGKYVKNTFWRILETLPESEVSHLLSHEYSLKTFGMGTYPILSKERNPSRYYASPVQIGGKKYFVCSQWRDQHWEKLKKWVKEHQDFK